MTDKTNSIQTEMWRKEFPSISKGEAIHLNHSMNSPPPQRGIEAHKQFQQHWIGENPHPWKMWRQKLGEAKERFADLINASAKEIAIVPSMTQSLAQISSALDYDNGEQVVTTEMEFPTVPQFWEAQRRRHGTTIKLAKSPNGVRVPKASYDKVINSDTSLVCTSHAFSATGGMIDPKAIADLSHDRGSLVFLDAYQSAGVVPIDVNKQNIDILSTGALKFLFGGPGIAFLYVDSNIIAELEPANLGWFGTEEKFEWENPEYAADASRFQLGTGPIPNAYMASAGLSVIQDVGINTIRDRTLEMTRRIIEGAEKRGFSVATPKNEDLRSSIVTILVKDHEKAYAGLTEEKIKVSIMDASNLVDSGLRVSPHFYTTSEEVDILLNSLEKNAVPTSH